MRSGARRLSSRLISGAAAALFSAAAIAEDGAVEWLVRMGDAARTQNYQGVLVYRDSDMLETLSLVHRHDRGQERERLVSLSGQPREIQRQNEQVTCLLPKQQLTAGNPGQHGLFPHLTRETLQKLSNHYELKMLGTARVAGRRCRGVAIKPRDGFRYGYQFWADEKTGVPLKVTLTAPDSNARVEEMVFTQVDFPKRIADSAFAADGPRTPAQPVTVAGESPQRKLQPSRWVLQQLPPGFEITMRDIRPLPDRRGDLEHLMISDGLSAVSVFMAFQPPPERFFQGYSRMGAVHAYGRMIGEYHIAVVGEVPRETVRLIGEGLREEDQSPARVNLIPPTP